MDLKRALERNFVLKTEYGAGASLAGGLFNRRVFERQNIRLDGAREQDRVYERVLKLGPARITHRSKNPSLISSDPHELSLTLFQLFAFSNDRDYLIAFKTGLKVSALKTLLGLTPAAAVGEVVDVDAAARAGFRLNLSRLMRDLKRDEPENPDEPDDDPDIDLF